MDDKQFFDLLDEQARARVRRERELYEQLARELAAAMEVDAVPATVPQ